MPPRFEETVASLAAAGAYVVIHTTTEGILARHLFVPVVKLSTDAMMLTTAPDDNDIDARGIAPKRSSPVSAMSLTASGRPRNGTVLQHSPSNASVL